MRSSSPARTFTIVGILGEVPLWSFFLVGSVWWISELAFSPARVVLLGLALEAGVLFTEVPTGIVADRFSRRWSVQISFVLIGASLLLHAATSNYLVMLVSLALMGLGWTFRSGADIAWLADQFGGDEALESDEVSSIIVRRQIAILLVNVVTVPITVLLGLWSIQGTIAIFGVVSLLGGLLVAPALDGVGNADSDLSFRQIATEGRRIATGNPVIRRILLVTFLLSLATPAVGWLGLERFLVRGDFDDQSLPFMGGLFVVVAIGAAAAVWAIERRLSDGVSFRLVTAGLIAVMATGTALVIAPPVALVALGILLHDTAWESLQPVIAGWVNPHTDDASRATVHSIVGQTGSLGEFVGGIVAASVVSFSGVNATLVVATALALVGAGVARTTPN